MMAVLPAAMAPTLRYYINIGCGGGIALENWASSEHRQTIISK